MSNFDDELGDFRPATAAALLRHGDRRLAVARLVAARARSVGADGVQIDLEALAPADAPGLVAFARALRSTLPAGAPTSLAISASEHTAGYRADGYDLPRLAKAVDRAVLMTYDQHGPGWSGPGPVGGIGWARRCVRAAEAAGVPRSKLDLGIAQYGYSWPRHGQGTTLTLRKARRAAGSRARYDRALQEWTATTADGTVLWWSDGRSLLARLAVARAEHLHGVAIWQLGSAE